MNAKYEEIRNLESIDAIIDKMEMNKSFVAKLLDDTKNLREILKESGFELSDQYYDIFEEFVSKIRDEKNIQLRRKESYVSGKSKGNS